MSAPNLEIISIQLVVKSGDTPYFTADFHQRGLRDSVIRNDAGDDILKIEFKNGKLLATPTTPTLPTRLNGSQIRLLEELRDGDTLTLERKNYTIHTSIVTAPAKRRPSQRSTSPRKRLTISIALLTLLAAGVFLLQSDWFKSPALTAQPSAQPTSSETPDIDQAEVNRLLGLTPPPAAANAAAANSPVSHAPTGSAMPLPATTDFAAQLGCAAASPDGQFLAIGGSDRVVRILDASTLQEIKVLSGHQHNISSLKFSSNSRWLLSGSYDTTLRLWDITTGKTIRVLNGHSAKVIALDLSPDDRYALSSDQEGVIMLWDIKNGEEIRWILGHLGPVTDLKFNSTGKQAFSVGSDGTLRHWNLTSGKQLQKFQIQKTGLNSIVVTPKDQFAILAADSFITTRQGISEKKIQTLQMWDLQSGQEIKRFAAFQQWAHCLALSPDGNTLILATGGDPKSQPGTKPTRLPTITIWDVTSGKLLHTLNGPEMLITSVTLLPDTQHFIATSIDRTLRAWSIPQ